MANKKCVAISCELELLDKAHKKAVEKAIRDIVIREVGKTKTLEFDKNCTDGWELKIKMTVTLDDPKAPKTMEAVAAIQAVPYIDGVHIVKASGNAKATGLSKNLEKDSAMTAGDALEAVLTKKLLPQMDK